MEKQIEIYQASDLTIEVRLVKETVWLSQKQMAVLFEKDTDTIGLHLKNIFQDVELDKSSTTEYLSTVQKEGKSEFLIEVEVENQELPS